MTKKKHHFLSRFYLEGFCDQNGMVWTFNRNNPNNSFAGKPENTAFRNRLYHLNIDSLDKKPEIDSIENFLAENIEDPAAYPFKKLKDKQFPNEHERRDLAKFFEFLFARTPGQIQHLRNMFDRDIKNCSLSLVSNKDHFHDSWKEFEPGSSYSEIEACRTAILSGDVKCGTHPNFVLDKMILSGSIIGELLCNMHWVMLEVNDTLPLITSDNLINVSHPDIPPSKYYQAGFGMPDVRVLVPLSKDLALLMVNSKSIQNNSVISIKNDEGKELNKLIYSLSNQHVYASSNSSDIKSLLIDYFNEINLIDE